MNTARPFSGPISVSLAGATLIALATASFTSGLWRQLNLPRPDHTAKVVIITPKEPAPAETLAFMAPTAAAPAKAPAPRRRPRTAPDLEPPPAPTEPGPALAAAAAVDAAAIAPVEAPPNPSQPPELAPPF